MRLLLFLAAAPLFAQDCSTLTAVIQPQHITAAPSDVTVTVTAPTGCRWTYAADSWLAVTTGQPNGIGSGNGSVAWRAALNILPVQREGTIAIVGVGSSAAATLKLTQDPPPAVTMSLQPASANYLAVGGAGTFRVNTNWYWSAGGNPGWIGVPSQTGGSGSGPVKFTVSANPCISQRSGSILVQPGSIQAPAQFQITQDGSPDNLSLSPASASVPPAESNGRVAVSTGSGCAWSAYSDSSWLQVTSGASGGANGIAYHANENKEAAARTAHIIVGPQTFTLTQQGVASPPVQLTAVVNAASYAPGAVSPGEIVALGGTNMGPAKGLPVQLAPDGASITKSLGSTQVLFDGTPAALTYVSATQVNAIVPYSLASRTTTQVQVQYQGVTSNALTAPVQAATPGIFALDASGAGAGAILNQDYSVNGAPNRADRGSVVMIYCTGAGVTNPASVDAAVTTTDPARLPLLAAPDVSVTIGGLPATIWYKGGAPAAVAGLTQINAQVPAGVSPGPAVPVVVKIGNWQSQTGITMAVK